MYIRLEGEDKFVRNLSNRSLINTDINSLNEYKTKKANALKINTISEEINTLKNEMSEIKSLLQQLVTKSAEK
jgi:hypothetical protein